MRQTGDKMPFSKFARLLGVFLLMCTAGWFVGKYSVVIGFAVGTATFGFLGFLVWAALFGAWLWVLFGTDYVNKLMTWASKG